MRYDEFLYDDVGCRHERKNLFIREYLFLKDNIDDNDYKNRLKDLIRNRSNHHYIKKLEEYIRNEKNFKNDLKIKKRKYKLSLNEIEDIRVKKYKLSLFEAECKENFYKDYVELTYDAELKYEDSKIVKVQVNDIIEFLERSSLEIAKLKDKLLKISLSDDRNIELKRFKGYRYKVNNEMQNELRTLKDKYKRKLISKEALLSEKIGLKIKYRYNIDTARCKVLRNLFKELIKQKQYDTKYIHKQKVRSMLEDRISLKRSVPCENENRKIPNAYIGLLFPGFAQLLNRQYVKSILFFIGTLYIYCIAIPYAIGFGNYQGQGLLVFFTLAEGGPRIHKSNIYMIEGILALIFIIFAMFIIILAFKDSLNVEKEEMRGIRRKSWYETKNAIFDKGFPYLISLPSLVVITFIIIVPIATSVLLSFTNMNPEHQAKFNWIGFSNYLNIIRGSGLAGSVFWNILGWTLIWTTVATTLSIFVGFTLALIVNNDRMKFKKIFRTIFLLPWAVPAFITIMFFSIMLSREGILTQLINNLTGLSLDIKNNTLQSRVAIILLQTWLGSSYVFLLSTGVLQSISGDLYEASEIDGASYWQKMKKITLPIVLHQTAPLLIGQYIFNFNNFSLIYLFNGGGPFNPKVYGNLAGSTDLLISYIYKLTIDNQQQAIGAAISVFISLGLMVVAYIGFKNSRAFKEEKI